LRAPHVEGTRNAAVVFPQVKERRAEGRKAAHAALETALAADNTEAELRRSIEASWRAEQDCERLRVRAVRACEEALARLQRMRELVRGSQNTEELRAVGRELVCAAGRDALCAMAVAAAAQEGVDVNTQARRWGRRVQGRAGFSPVQERRHHTDSRLPSGTWLSGGASSKFKVPRRRYLTSCRSY
jgi:hypothetical protein